MKDLKFKTNIKCGACEATVTPHLDKLENSSWAVDLKHPERILTVKGAAEENQVVKAVEEAGFVAQPI